MTRLSSYAAILLLAAINLAALWLAMHPNVSDRYRAYYIERTTDCWPAPVTGDVPLGRRVWYLKGDAGTAAEDTLRCGWIGFQGNGTWSHGDEARLAFDLRKAEGVLVELQMLPYLAPGSERQRLVARIGDRSLAELTLDRTSPQRFVLDIPGELLGRDGPTELVFELPDAVSPEALGLSADRRRLAVRLISVLITAKNERERGPT